MPFPSCPGRSCPSLACQTGLREAFPCPSRPSHRASGLSRHSHPRTARPALVDPSLPCPPAARLSRLFPAPPFQACRSKALLNWSFLVCLFSPHLPIRSSTHPISSLQITSSLTRLSNGSPSLDLQAPPILTRRCAPGHFCPVPHAPDLTSARLSRPAYSCRASVFRDGYIRASPAHQAVPILVTRCGEPEGSPLYCYA